MKKGLLFGFAAALTLASCTTNDEVLEVAKQQEMSFTTFVDKATKAPIDNNNKYFETDDAEFGVWGYKTKNNVVSPVFKDQLSGEIAQKVYKSEEGWTYDNPRYWDQTCSYRFYGYAPYECVESATFNQELKKLTTGTYTVGATVEDQKDFLITIEQAYTTKASGKIALTFKHALSKVSVNFLKASEYEVILKKAKLTVPNTGTCVTTITNAAITPVWTRTGQALQSFTNDNGLTLHKETATSVFSNYLLIPTTNKDKAAQLVIEYTVDGEYFQREFALEGGEWAPNTNITYTITIQSGTSAGGGVIGFDNPTVSGWEADTTPSHTVNDNVTE